MDSFVIIEEDDKRNGPDLALAPNVPDVELESLRLDGFDVEALGRRDGGDVLAATAVIYKSYLVLICNLFRHFIIACKFF